MLKNKCLKNIILLLFFSIYFNMFQANAATINASSCYYNDVQVAINSASGGDTVIIPSGNCTWAGGSLTFSKEITVSGAGKDQTVLIMSNPNEFFYVTGTTNNLRITGFTFDGNNSGGGIQLKGNHHGFRIDNCKFINTCCGSINRPITVGEGYCDGVIDHNEFINNNSRTDVLVYGDSDEDWNRPIVLGGSDGVVFVEDNTFTYNNLNLSNPEHVMSSGYGGRYVFRYNTIDAAYGGSLHLGGVIDAHGYCFYGRGTVSYEIYNNTIESDHSYRGMFIRGGTGVIYDNTFIGDFVKKIHLTNLRSFWSCTGSGVSPSTCTEGYPCRDQINDLYMWNNKLGGNTVTATTMSDGSVPNHIQEGRDYFHFQKSEYTPFPYPHPLIHTDPVPSTVAGSDGGG